MDKIVVWLQIEAKANIRQTESPFETADFLTRLTETIAQVPYKYFSLKSRFLMRRRESAFSGFCAESVSKKGNDPWIGQLQQINGVSYQVAKVISRVYPTFGNEETIFLLISKLL